MKRDTKSPDLPGAAGLSRVLGVLRHQTAGTCAHTKLLIIDCYMNRGAVRAALGLSNPLQIGMVPAVGHRLLDLMVGEPAAYATGSPNLRP